MLRFAFSEPSLNTDVCSHALNSERKTDRNHLSYLNDHARPDELLCYIHEGSRRVMIAQRYVRYRLSEFGTVFSISQPANLDEFLRTSRRISVRSSDTPPRGRS